MVKSTKPESPPEQDNESLSDQPATPFDDSPDTPTRPSEKKRLQWEGKTRTCCSLSCLLAPVYIKSCPDLAPLATVGNLVCSLYSGDITCLLKDYAAVQKTMR